MAEDKASSCLIRKAELMRESILSVPKEKGRGSFQGSQVRREVPQVRKEKRVCRP